MSRLRPIISKNRPKPIIVLPHLVIRLFMLLKVERPLIYALFISHITFTLVFSCLSIRINMTVHEWQDRFALISKRMFGNIYITWSDGKKADLTLFDRRDKDNVCYCETCGHKTARECIELLCSCCLKADQIRLNHVIVPESDLSQGEKERREESERADEKREQDAQMRNWFWNW